MSDDILELEIQPSYIGSAYTPQVEVTETSGGHNVAITYDDAESGITTVDFDVLNGAQGPQGETGATGATGAAAGFGTVSATVDDSTGTPSVEVTTSGEDTAKNFAFAFHNLKGETGEPGEVQADGHYPMLRAGLADALASSYGETATFAQRTSTRNGAVEIQSILGNTVVENGELVSVNISGITSAGNTLEIPASTYFPQGMRGVGSAHDALYRNHADTVVGVLEFDGSDDENWIEWSSSSIASGYKFYYSGGITVPTATRFANFLCNYAWSFNNDYGNYSSGIKFYIDGSYKFCVFGPENEIGATLSAFKTMLENKPSILQFQHNAPTTQTIDPPLNMSYPVEQGGTESIIVPTGSTSAAPTFITLYAYDADGIIDKSQSIIAQVESGTASTNYAVNSYLVMRGTLYRVTSAIATGETITPGTNCTATTVMAEVIRLTA